MPRTSPQDCPRPYTRSGVHTLKKAVQTLGSRVLPSKRTALGHLDLRECEVHPRFYPRKCPTDRLWCSDILTANQVFGPNAANHRAFVRALRLLYGQ